MKFDFRNTKIYIKAGKTKMNQSKEELLFKIRNEMKQNPMNGAVFIFCNGTNKIKMIWWDKNGFWEAKKTLEKGHWKWPKTEAEKTPANLLLILMEIQKGKENLDFKSLD